MKEQQTCKLYVLLKERVHTTQPRTNTYCHQKKLVSFLLHYKGSGQRRAFRQCQSLLPSPALSNPGHTCYRTKKKDRHKHLDLMHSMLRNDAQYITYKTQTTYQQRAATEK